MRPNILFSYLLFLINISNAQIGKENELSKIKDTSIVSSTILSPYNFSLGTNFDFINGVDLKDLYFNVSTFSRNLVKFNKIKFGIYTGVRKGFARTYTKFLDVLPHESKSNENGLFFKNKYSIQKYSNLGLVNTTFYLNPFITLIESENKIEGNSFSCFLSLNLDLKKQELLWDYKYDTIEIENIEIDEDTYNNLPSRYLVNSEFYDQYLYSIGIGLPFIIENANSVFIGNVNIGYSKVKRLEFWDLNRFNLGLSFEIIEKEFGLNLRTEVQFFQINSPPYIAFNLAKYFNLKDVVKFAPN